MLEIRRIESEGEAIAALQKHNPEGIMPEFMFHEPRYQGIVICLLDDGEQAGLAFGVTAKGDPCFYLHHISVGSQYASSKIICSFFELLFVWLREKCERNRMTIVLTQEDVSEPPFLRFLYKIPTCSVEDVVHIRQLGVKTSDFSYLRQFHWYCPELMEKKHCEAIRWKDYDETELQKIRKAEISGQTEAGYLSPGVWDSEWKYDEETSFVLVEKGKKAPLGWIITEKVGDGIVKLRRFYIYNEARKKLLGPAFSTWVLDVIEQHYDHMYYEVIKGNRQMEMFTNHYCKPILEFNYDKCYITVSF